MKQQRPILFSTPMVQAILAGRKTQTRRIVKPKSFKGEGVHVNNCPYGQVGDQLWVREAWSTHAEFHGVMPSSLETRSIHYWADGECQTGKKRPSIHMPRWASRILLEITDIRVERLQDISEADAKAEGCCYGKGGGVPDLAVSPEDHFPTLWESINGADSWAANPWVWCVSFKVVEPQGGDL